MTERLIPIQKGAAGGIGSSGSAGSSGTSGTSGSLGSSGSSGHSGISEFKDYLSILIGHAVDGANPPDAIETLTSTNSVQIRKFDYGNPIYGPTPQDVFISVVLPPDIKPATDKIKFRVHFFITESSLPRSKIVRFALKGRAFGLGDLLSAELGTHVYVPEVIMDHTHDTLWSTGVEYQLADNRVGNGRKFEVTDKTGTGKTSTPPIWPSGGSVVEGNLYHNITQFSDYGGTIPGAVLVTSTGHGLPDGTTSLTISGSEIYDGTFDAVKIDVDTFYIMTTWDYDPTLNHTPTFTYPGDTITWTYDVISQYWGTGIEYNLNNRKIPIPPNNGRWFQVTDKTGTGKTSTEPLWPMWPSGGSVVESNLYHDITAFSDYGGTVSGAVLVTSATHSLPDGTTLLTISGTTHYNGAFVATKVDVNTFYIMATWNGDDATGTFTYSGDTITWTNLLSTLNVLQYSYVITDWSNDVTITNLSPTSTFLELNLYRDEDDSADIYGQKVGVAFIELQFDRTPSV